VNFSHVTQTMNKIVLEMNWSIGIVDIKLASVSAVLYPNPYSLRNVTSFLPYCGSGTDAVLLDLLNTFLK
jgi:hypothetical protein